MKFIIYLFIIIIQVVYSKDEIQKAPKLSYYSPLMFFNLELNSLINVERTRRRLKSINRNLKERARKEAFSLEDPYLNPERFTQSKLWRFFNFFKLKNKKKRQPRHPGRIINSFSFEEYLILNYNQNSTNNNKTDNITLNTNNSTQELNQNKPSRCCSLENFSLYSNNLSPTDYSGVPEILNPRRPKNIIIAILGVSSDKVYYEAFKYTYYPFISQLKMYGDQFRKDTGIIFAHPYLRKFKPIGSIKWVYRFAWADFSFGFRFKQVNLKQWMYSVDSVLMLIDYLIQVEKYDPKKIFLYGYSQGGALALSITLRSKYTLGGTISTASFLPERAMKNLMSMEPKITNQGLKTPILLSFCNPDFVFPYKSAKKDIKFFKEHLKANIKNSLMLGEGHSCFTRYTMVYVDWIYSIISNYKGSQYKPKEFLFKLLEIENDFQKYYNFGLSNDEKESAN